MSDQLLDNFLTLKIPDVHGIVFAPRHDILAACNTEACIDAVLRVYVSGIFFEDLQLCVVQQSNGTVMGSAEHIFRIGRELHVLTDASSDQERRKCDRHSPD